MGLDVYVYVYICVCVCMLQKPKFTYKSPTHVLGNLIASNYICRRDFSIIELEVLA